MKTDEEPMNDEYNLEDATEAVKSNLKHLAENDEVFDTIVEWALDTLDSLNEDECPLPDEPQEDEDFPEEPKETHPAFHVMMATAEYIYKRTELREHRLRWLLKQLGTLLVNRMTFRDETFTNVDKARESSLLAIVDRELKIVGHPPIENPEE